MEEKWNELANKLDLLPKEERKFALWYLLREYYVTDLNIPENPQNVKEYQEMVFKRDLNVSVSHIIEILGFDLWG